jgi:hypothetical protein
MTIKQMLLMMLCGFAGAFVFSIAREVLIPRAFAAPDRVVTASAFQLTDARGKLRAQLAFAKEGPPGLWLMDEKGTARAIIGLYPDGSAHIGLQDERGQMIQLMRSYGPKGTPLHIFKLDGQDKMITGLNPGADPVPFLMSYEQGKKKVHFGQYEGP